MTTTQTLTRDPKYYKDDQVIVLRVEDVLFKIETSRLFDESEAFKNMLEFPVTADGAEGMSDANPVILPQVKAEEFRSLLYIFYESPVDPALIVFLSGASNTQNHCAKAYKRYLDIASLSNRFCMRMTEEWARNQLGGIIDYTTDYRPWLNLDLLFTTFSYATHYDSNPDNNFMRSVRNTLSRSIRVCTDERLVGFYENPPKYVDRALHGLLFSRVLSLGHKSAQWEQLSWTDRVTLYVAQVHLTPLPDLAPFSSLASLDDIINSGNESGEPLSVCWSTDERLRDEWSISPSWRSNVPLEGVSTICNLPLKAIELKESLGLECIYCRDSAKCLGGFLARVDRLIELVLVEMANQHDTFSKMK